MAQKKKINIERDILKFNEKFVELLKKIKALIHESNTESKKINFYNLPKTENKYEFGVYFLSFKNKPAIQYIGTTISRDLIKRIKQSINSGHTFYNKLNDSGYSMKTLKENLEIQLIKCETAVEAEMLEHLAIGLLAPKFNLSRKTLGIQKEPKK